jgi:glycosyltransferase involved in cell wall biosynthesis
MAVRKTIVTSDTLAVREVLADHHNPLLCDSSDPESLASALVELKQDRTLRGRIAENAYDLFAERFSTRQIGAALLQVVESVL